MKKGSEVKLEITSVDFPNKGFGFINDEKIMVKNTLPGQTILARITKKRNNKFEAIALEVISNAPGEIKPGCMHFGVCGGCLYQNYDFKMETELKKEQVLRLLEREGIKDFIFEGIITPEKISGYRNKCEFSFGDDEKGGKLCLGMRKKKSFYEVVELTDCNIVDSDYLKIIEAATEFFRLRCISFYHKKYHTGELRHLVIRKAAKTGEILINLVTSGEVSFSPREFAEIILSLKLEGEIKSILHTINDGFADIVKSDSTHILYGRDYIEEELLGKKFKISVFSFFQTNTEGAELLYSVIRKFAGEEKNKLIFDLYCGGGAISLILSDLAEEVIGIEIFEEAVLSAKENAQRNGITNCVFLAGDVLKEADELPNTPDLIILDPPREGIHPKAISKISDLGAKRMIYVSCKPTSMAKDLKAFEDNGYKAARVKCVNQFPRTAHVETCVLLSHKNS